MQFKYELTAYSRPPMTTRRARGLPAVGFDVVCLWEAGCVSQCSRIQSVAEYMGVCGSPHVKSCADYVRESMKKAGPMRGLELWGLGAVPSSTPA